MSNDERQQKLNENMLMNAHELRYECSVKTDAILIEVISKSLRLPLTQKILNVLYGYWMHDVIICVATLN